LIEYTWGLLGPELISNTRRVRTLGLGATVRLFNDLAVPGLGGVWYGKQLLLATLGVAVAEQARSKGAQVQNIEVANAIEALACWLAFKSNDWKRDSRLRGNTKLQSKTDFLFKDARQRNFYVTQPMRMVTVQALPALGLVKADGTRFNAFQCSDAGSTFIDQACKDYRPFKRSVIDYLVRWVMGKNGGNSDKLHEALSPLISLPKDTLPLLRERLIQGGKESPKYKQRRKDALDWVENIRGKPSKQQWNTKPELIDDKHWHDLVAGAKIFSARDSAIAVLDALEAHIGNKTQVQIHSLQTTVPAELSTSLKALKEAAQAFLNSNHCNQEANAFCRECVDDDTAKVLRSLVQRDGNVLRLIGEDIRPGPAFRGSALTAINSDRNEEGDPVTNVIPLPEGISFRMRNLYLLNLDLHGELDTWLNPTEGEVQ